jgi:hypothetical protein
MTRYFTTILCNVPLNGSIEAEYFFTNVLATFPQIIYELCAGIGNYHPLLNRKHF